MMLPTVSMVAARHPCYRLSRRYANLRLLLFPA